MRQTVKFTAPVFVTTAAFALVAFLGGSASAATLHSEQASATSTSPTLDANCNEVTGYENPRATAGLACFRPYGDKFYVRDTLADGHHIEVRGTVNRTGDNFRCYEHGGSSAGWQVCDGFHDEIPENSTIYWEIGLWEGGTLLGTGGDPKFSSTS
ncbi:hypothetical protein [Streptomyces pactum]|uniref:hypothetical protein n=1 Tax=Streptomyces pactum TaxID=68249 RepID=UPI00131AC07A|nr:hypothetical protein [Streptomyces pactum]